MNLPPIDSDSLSKNLFINKEGYYLNEDFTLVVEKGSDRELLGSLYRARRCSKELEGSLYNQKGWLVEAYYDIFEM